MFALVGKKAGVSSFWALSLLRQHFGTRKIGHAGTLDPLATGLLIVATDESTKLLPYLEDYPKTYRFTVDFSATSDSLDLGTPLKKIDSDWEKRLRAITKEEVLSTIKTFIGNIKQVPPIYSALKVEWKRSYKLARSWENPELKERDSTVFSLKLLDCSLPCATFEASVSGGTYVRSLARDIGAELWVLGVVTKLERIAIGPFEAPPEWVIQTMDESEFFRGRMEEITEKERKEISEGTRIENRFGRENDSIFLARYNGVTVSVLQARGDGKCSIRRNLNV